MAELEILDKKDREILYELDCNARQSNAQIAKKVHVNENVVGYRINKLIETGVIKSFYSIIDTSLLGFEGFRAYLKFQYITPLKKKEIIDFINKNKSTWWVGSLEGPWDIGFIAWVKDIYEFQKLWLKLLEKYQEHIAKSNISIYTKIYDFSYAFLSPEKRAEKKTFMVGTQKRIKATNSQKKILKIFSANARTPTIDIARETRLSALTVSHNIKKLKDAGVIKGYRVMLDIKNLGLTHYKVHFYLRNRSHYPEMVGYAEQHPNIIYVNEAIGLADFELEALVQNHQEFKELVEEITGLFGDEIKSYEYIIFSEIHKIRYFE